MSEYGETWFYEKLETATFIFAILNFIFYALLNIACVICLILVNTMFYNAYTRDDINYLNDLGISVCFLDAFWYIDVIDNLAIVLTLVFIAVQLVLSVYLISGLNRSSISDIKIYLVNNIVYNLALYIAAIYFHMPLMIHVSAIIYTVILLMIYLTYRDRADKRSSVFEENILPVA